MNICFSLEPGGQGSKQHVEPPEDCEKGMISQSSNSWEMLILQYIFLCN